MDTVNVFDWQKFKRIKYDMVMPDTVMFITSVERFRELDPVKYPDLKASIEVLKKCERKGNIDNPHIALFVISFLELMSKVKFDAEFVPLSMITPDEVYAECLRKARDHMMKHFGSLEVPWAKMGKDGLHLESVNAYGASNKPDSKHYTDQMEMFVNQQTKPMTLDKQTIWKNAERIYHPDYKNNK
jgi:acyl-homoserine-lactone acylase